MQTLTHLLSGVAVALVMAPTPLSAGCLVAASIAPDRMDAILAHGDDKRWGKIHRGPTHNLWYWLVGLVLSAFWIRAAMPPGETKTWLEHLLPWLFGGGMLHLALDVLTPMGVPYLPLSRKRFSFKLIRTGHFADYVLGLALFGGACIYSTQSGRFSDLSEIFDYIDMRQFFIFLRHIG